MHTVPNSDELLKEIKLNGFSVVRQINYSIFLSIIAGLGQSINVADIKYDKTKRVKLNSCAMMPFHTDHPKAQLITWYCRQQADFGGSSLLLDIQKVIDESPVNIKQALEKILVNAPEVNEACPMELCPVVSNDGVYFAEWLIKGNDEIEQEKALSYLQEKIQKTTPVNIRLKQNDVLFIDNKRMLHSRESFTEIKHSRLLERHWIRLS